VALLNIRLAALALTLAAVVPQPPPAARAQEVSLEYNVKAAYLFNFTKFVEWPPRSVPGPLTICVAGRNVFGDVLTELVRGERANGRPIDTRVILEPDPGCHMLFVPRGAAASAYLRAARGMPVFTVGESEDFLDLGGIANFILDGANVRFEIDAHAAELAGLRVSSRLLRLGRDGGAA
jgi:hypothetical protein